MTPPREKPTVANATLGDDWFPSRWGPDDQRGNDNHQGPDKVLAALTLVRDGTIGPLGFPYSADMPLSPGRSFSLRMPRGPTGGPMGDASRTIRNDDFIATEIDQIGTHMDALGHAGCVCGGSALFYNGDQLDTVWSPHGLKQLGIEKALIFFVRGILLDVQKFAGRPLNRGEVIDADMLSRCAAAQRMPEPLVASGEVVLVRTGHVGATGSPGTPFAIL